MYYFVSNSEDGLRVDGPFSESDALARIEDLTSADILPDYRARFVDELPGWDTPLKHVCIIKGEPIIPKPVNVVTEYTL